jgi:hypothetical protein
VTQDKERTVYTLLELSRKHSLKMATLTLAAKANTSILLPALLTAAYINQSCDGASVTTKFEDVETIGPTGQAVQLEAADEPALSGSPAILALLRIFLKDQSEVQQKVSFFITLPSAFLASVTVW